MTLPEERLIDLVQRQEDITLGQRVSSFRVDVWAEDDWRLVADGTTIGYKRLLPIDPVRTRKLRVTVTGSLAPPHLSGVCPV